MVKSNNPDVLAQINPVFVTLSLKAEAPSRRASSLIRHVAASWKITGEEANRLDFRAMDAGRYQTHRATAPQRWTLIPISCIIADLTERAFVADSLSFA